MTTSPMKILIIDDDDVVTDTFARMLRLEGHAVRTALSAELGLREADREPPNVIIVDFRMPLTDGLGFLHRLRAMPQNRSTPVAIVTGDYFLDDSVLREIGDLGAHLHFKPMWLEDLVALTHSLLASDRHSAPSPVLTH